MEIEKEIEAIKQQIAKLQAELAALQSCLEDDADGNG